MKMNIGEMTAAGLDLEAVQNAMGFYADLREPGQVGQESRLLCLRAIADLARENAAARLIVGELLDAVAEKRPEGAETFLAYYLEGETKPSARQVAQRLYMDRATVLNHTRRIFTAMLPVTFGPAFEEKPKPPRERTKPSPHKRRPQHRRAFFALLDDVSRIAYTYREQETAQEAPGSRQETPPGAGEG